MNSHADMGFTVGNFQKLLDVLNLKKKPKQNPALTMYAYSILYIMLHLIQTSESETTSTSSPTQSMKSYAIPKLSNISKPFSANKRDVIWTMLQYATVVQTSRGCTWKRACSCCWILIWWCRHCPVGGFLSASWQEAASGPSSLAGGHSLLEVEQQSTWPRRSFLFHCQPGTFEHPWK